MAPFLCGPWTPHDAERFLDRVAEIQLLGLDVYQRAPRAERPKLRLVPPLPPDVTSQRNV